MKKKNYGNLSNTVSTFPILLNDIMMTPIFKQEALKNYINNAIFIKYFSSGKIVLIIYVNHSGKYLFISGFEKEKFILLHRKMVLIVKEEKEQYIFRYLPKFSTCHFHFNDYNH